MDCGFCEGLGNCRASQSCIREFRIEAWKFRGRREVIDEWNPRISTPEETRKFKRGRGVEMGTQRKRKF